MTRIRAAIISLVFLATSAVALVSFASPSGALGGGGSVDCGVHVDPYFHCPVRWSVGITK